MSLSSTYLLTPYKGGIGVFSILPILPNRYNRYILTYIFHKSLRFYPSPVVVPY